jgi:hypothetical protein
MLWMLSQSDGTASLLDVAERSGIDLSIVHGAAEDLAAAGLLRDKDKRRGRAGKKPSTRKKDAIERPATKRALQSDRKNVMRRPLATKSRKGDSA